MNGERQLFQQSLVPQIFIRPSWRNGLGWGAVLVDFTLASLLPGWRLGSLMLPTWALLFVTRKAAASEAIDNSSDSSPKSQGTN